MDPIEVRAATSHDVAAVATLAAHARLEAEDTRGGHLLFDLTHASIGQHDRYNAAISAPDEYLCVAEISGALVGFASASTEAGTTERICAISELFVHPQARTVGVGSLLLENTQAWARQAGCSYVESQVLPGNRAAKNFFERVGMVTRAMRVSASLSAADDAL